MKIRLLPSTFDSQGAASNRQHYSCLIVDNMVAIDAGSLATGLGDEGKNAIRDIVITHAHLDHIAGLPLFIDDLFPVLKEPVRVHASRDVIEILENHIFNWQVYPRFSELSNDFGRIVTYIAIENDMKFQVRGLDFKPIATNHRVPSFGFVVSNGLSAFAMTGDTAEMEEFWNRVNSTSKIDLLLIECAFPDEHAELARISHHLTPKKLAIELEKFSHTDCPIRVINIKPAYRDAVVSQLRGLNIERLEILEIGREYEV